MLGVWANILLSITNLAAIRVVIWSFTHTSERYPSNASPEMQRPLIAESQLPVKRSKIVGGVFLASMLASAHYHLIERNLRGHDLAGGPSVLALILPESIMPSPEAEEYWSLVTDRVLSVAAAGVSLISAGGWSAVMRFLAKHRFGLVPTVFVSAVLGEILFPPYGYVFLHSVWHVGIYSGAYLFLKSL
ncbi:hypothetical protein BJ742DRAFT_825436 [Cladochytrium replicatum]|nr:hypothetical protein BJ742DRAFT_825436 [Cladochytrium replicatum]